LIDRHQPAQTVRIEQVLATEVQQHLRLHHPIDTTIVRDLHVTHDRPIAVLPLRRPQIHAHTTADTPNKCKHPTESHVPTLSSPSNHPQPVYQELRAPESPHVPINCGTRAEQATRSCIQLLDSPLHAAPREQDTVGGRARRRKTAPSTVLTSRAAAGWSDRPWQPNALPLASPLRTSRTAATWSATLWTIPTSLAICRRACATHSS